MKVTESEQIILNLLWDKGNLSIMQMVKVLEEETGWTKHAVISFLKKMESKGTVTYEVRNRTKYYSAVPSKGEMAKKESSSLLKKFYNGKLGVMVSSMAEENQLSEEDIRDLWNVLQELKENEMGK